jgi:hypothetical protein
VRVEGQWELHLRDRGGTGNVLIMVAEGVTAERSFQLLRTSQSKVEECGCSSIETITFRTNTPGFFLLLLWVHLFWLFIWVLSGYHAAAAEPITPTRFVLLFLLLFWRWCAFLSATSRATLVCSLHWASAEEEEQYAYNEDADYRYHWRNDLGVCDRESCGLSCSLEGGRNMEEWGWKKHGGMRVEETWRNEGGRNREEWGWKKQGGMRVEETGRNECGRNREEWGWKKQGGMRVEETGRNEGGRRREEWGWKKREEWGSRKQGGKWRKKGKGGEKRGRHGGEKRWRHEGEEEDNEGMEKKSQVSRMDGNSRGSMVEVIEGIEEGGIGEPRIYNSPF